MSDLEEGGVQDTVGRSLGEILGDMGCALPLVSGLGHFAQQMSMGAPSLSTRNTRFEGEAGTGAADWRSYRDRAT